MSTLIDLTGEEFVRLTVLRSAGRNKHNRTLWECRCTCGNITVVDGNSLRRGATRSCGCLGKEYRHSRKMHSKTHGKTHTRLYAVWKGMKQRCYDPNHNRYHRYGGRGISVCPEWRSDFEAFEAWAFANGYDETAPQGQCTLDRIDNDGDYTPENCRWTTAQEQYFNRDRGFVLADVARSHDLTPDAVYQRIKKGKSLKAALSEPLRRVVRVEVGGAVKTIKQLAADTGVPESTLYGRERRGLTGDDLIKGGG